MTDRSFPDLWARLAADRSPKVLYGTGNGADKLLDVCAAKSIPISAVFASDGFVRSRTFRGFPVRSYADVCREYPDGFTVLLAFASTLDSVIANVEKIASEHPLLVPDLPVAGDILFDAAFASAHSAELAQAKDLFSDGRSREVFDLIAASKLHGELNDLLGSADGISLPIAAGGKYFVDLGAYTGDTAALAAENGTVPGIIASEPDRKSFAKLEKRCAELKESGKISDVLLSDRAVWSESGKTLVFSAKASRGSSREALGGKPTEVLTVTVDELCAGKEIGVIKYDVEGAEAEALLGSQKTIRRCRPKIALSAYHRPEDLFLLPRMLKEILPEYRLSLRRRRCLPAWETVIYAEADT